MSMGLPRQGYWGGLPFPSLGDLPNPRIKPRSPALRAGSLPTEPPRKHTYVHVWEIFHKALTFIDFVKIQKQCRKINREL